MDGIDIAALRARAYHAHPLLDPRFRSRQRTALRFWLTVHRTTRAAESPPGTLARLASPVSETPTPPLPMQLWYAEEADQYIDGLLRDLPAPEAERLAPANVVRRTHAWSALLHLAFEGLGRRERYEARRKVYLATMLFGIDHSRAVRDGPRHKAQLESLLARTLWRGVEAEGERQICFAVGAAGGGHAGHRPVAGVDTVERWCFDVKRIGAATEGCAIDIYEYRSRFKRDALVTATLGEDGQLRLRSGDAGNPEARRSGSILSKMIRRGIADAHTVSDLLGAMFIVGDRTQAYALEARLVDALGGPFRWRDRVDTLSATDDHVRLAASSFSGFRVLKQIVDLLVTDPSGGEPYQFPVEIQIHSLESYLQTLSLGHAGSHRAYKRRQLLGELIPILFPQELFGGAR